MNLIDTSSLLTKVVTGVLLAAILGGWKFIGANRALADEAKLESARVATESLHRDSMIEKDVQGLKDDFADNRDKLDQIDEKLDDFIFWIKDREIRNAERGGQ